MFQVLLLMLLLRESKKGDPNEETTRLCSVAEKCTRYREYTLEITFNN